MYFRQKVKPTRLHVLWHYQIILCFVINIPLHPTLTNLFIDLFHHVSRRISFSCQSYVRFSCCVAYDCRLMYNVRCLQGIVLRGGIVLSFCTCILWRVPWLGLTCYLRGQRLALWFEHSGMTDMLPHAWDTRGGFKGSPLTQTSALNWRGPEGRNSTVCSMYVCIYIYIYIYISTVLIRLQADLSYKPRPQTSHAKN